LAVLKGLEGEGAGSVHVVLGSALKDGHAREEMEGALGVHLAVSSCSSTTAGPSWMLPGPVGRYPNCVDDYLKVVKAMHKLMGEDGRGARAATASEGRVSSGQLWALVNALWGQEKAADWRKPLPIRGEGLLKVGKTCVHISPGLLDCLVQASCGTLCGSPCSAASRWGTGP
jgi:hypothetical protein